MKSRRGLYLVNISRFSLLTYEGEVEAEGIYAVQSHERGTSTQLLPRPAEHVNKTRKFPKMTRRLASADLFASTLLSPL